MRNLSKPRDFTVAGHTQLVGDWRAVLDDPEINTVVEVMGGVTDAKEVRRRALRDRSCGVACDGSFLENG